MPDLTRDQLLQMVEWDEDNFIERKPAKGDVRQFRKTIVAFANSVPDDRCAVLFIGVRDDGTPEGCPNPDELQRQIRSACSACYPPINPRSEVIEKNGAKIVAVIVSASTNRPHFAGTSFIRRGSESVAAPAEVFDQLVHSRISKVAAIQKLLGGQVCTLGGLGHKLGDPQGGIPPSYRRREDGVVLSVDPQVMRFQILGSMRYIAEPLGNVTLMRDEERDRPMLIVKGY